MEGQDLSQLRRIHRRRSRTDAPNLTQPENVGNTIQPTLEQNSPRTTPSVQSRKLGRNPKTGQPNTRLRSEKGALISRLVRSIPADGTKPEARRILLGIFIPNRNAP